MASSKNIFPRRLVFLAISAVCALTLSACGGDGGDDGNKEFVASAQDFSNYKSWEVADYTIGASNPVLGPAHMGNDNGFSRRTFRGPTAKIVNGEYPVGSIIVKETFTWENGVKKFPATGGGVFAMVKRGNGFNATGGGWEWLELSPDGSQIVGRGGADMMGGICNACHSLAAKQAGGGDNVFAHPSEFTAAAADFANYRSWSKIEEESGSKPLLGGAHQGADPTAIRRIYKKQIMANPDTTQQGYPVGTLIVKEVQQNSAITEITAMVKRGGTFNATNGGWEWFMLDPSNSAIIARGDNLLGGACNGCHSQTKNPINGIDYVFKHPGDPFNK